MVSDTGQIDSNVKIGYPSNDPQMVALGACPTIRSGSVIYQNVSIGNNFQSGHNVVIRSHTKIGDHVVIGTNSVLEGHISLGSFIKIESSCFVPSHTVIGNRVFIGPNAVFTNDKYPLKQRDKYIPLGPIIEDGVTICAGALILPGIKIGKGSFVAAGALVTKDVPNNSLVIGSPGEIKPLKDTLLEENIALSWRCSLD